MTDWIPSKSNTQTAIHGPQTPTIESQMILKHLNDKQLHKVGKNVQKIEKKLLLEHLTTKG